MVTGHFGFAAGVKAKEQFVPLWALMLASVWLDILFIPLFAVGAESIDDVPGTDGGYGDVIIHADYTHSLVGALLISVVTGWIATRWWGRRGGIVIGAVVFSHWVLDLIVHRDDMPLLPGNLGDVRVGFGLWKVEWAAILTEAAIMVAGAYLYWRAAQAVERAAGVATGRANLVAGLLVLFGAIVLTLDVALA
ncbi:MAG TPA: metal-dependent hydrolase [Gaiellaceae bacterium]|nr:metal-dependent hydrolase [Gaiellaceae bacterium]